MKRGAKLRQMPPEFPADARTMTKKALMRKYRVGPDVLGRWHEEIGFHRGQGNHKRPVAQYDPETGALLAVWPSASEAGRAMYGRSKQSNGACICGCCKGRYKTACGYVWRFWTGPIPSRETIRKRETSRRLQEFRDRYDLGSDVRLAEASEGKLTPERVRAMREGLPHRLRDWDALAGALDRIGAEGAAIPRPQDPDR